MKRKLKFVSLTLSMMMCLSIMVFGVFAATTASFTVSNTVQFTYNAGSQIIADVEYKVVGSAMSDEETYKTLVSFVNEQTPESTVNQTYSIPELTFGGDNSDDKEITITIKFTNKSTTAALNVNWVTAALASATNVSLSGDLTATEGTTRTVASEGYTELTLVYTVINPMSTAGASAELTPIAFSLTTTENSST